MLPIFKTMGIKSLRSVQPVMGRNFFQLQRLETLKRPIISNMILTQTRNFHATPLIRDTFKDEIKKQIEKAHFPKPRITKEELLAQATGFVDKLKIRSKWILIRNNRPFTIDEISAFFSWFVMGNVLWVILGTTTFCSIILFLVNTVFAKEVAAKVTGKLITEGLNLNIDFEDAVFPEWRKGMIRFNNINCTTIDNEKSKLKFQLNIERINLTFSFSKWYDGKGLIQDIEVYGMRGAIHRGSSSSQEDDKERWIPSEYEISSVKICDSSIEIYEPNHLKPLKVAIFNCDLPKLRGNWLLADFFNASNVTGSINDSMFTIHKRQHQLAHLNNDDSKTNYWKRVTRLRIDSIDLSNNENQRFNWLVNGKAELTADIMLPNDIEIDDVKTSEIIQNFVNNILDNASNSNSNETSKRSETNEDQDDHKSKYVVIDFKVKFSDLTASIPQTLPRSINGQPFVSLTDLRSIVTYINNLKSNNRTLLPIKARILKDIDNLKNSSSLQNSGIVDLITIEIYEDLIKHVEEEEKLIIQNKSNLWSHSVASQLLLVGLGVMA